MRLPAWRLKTQIRVEHPEQKEDCMRFMTKLTALSVLMCCTATFAYRQAPEVTPDVVIEGVIDGVAAGTMPTIIVNSTRVFLTSQTVIKNDVGYVRPADLKMGMKVSVFGVLAKGGVLARLIVIGAR